MTVFVCGQPAGPSCCAPGCGRRDTRPCQQPLFGTQLGKICGRPVCAAHEGQDAEDSMQRRLCPAHARLAAGKTR